tara:strand:+ start:14914 stop:16797 length:1884 start_codon:yes stop_codon:yes gene_type:complete
MAQEEEIIAKVGIDTGDSDKQLESVKQGVEDIGGATEKTAKKSPKLVKGVKAIGTSFKKIVGAVGVVFLLQKAFEFLSEALQRNQKVADTISTVFDTISIVFNQIVNVLVDVYENVAKSSENFDALGKVMNGIITISLSPLKAAFYGIKLGIQELMLAWEKSPLGGNDKEKIAEFTLGIQESKDALKDVAVAVVDAGKDIVENFVEAVTETTNIVKKVSDGIKTIDVEQAQADAKNAKRLKNQSALAEAQIKGLIEENDRLSESQRQIRDDETKTFQERIEANEKLAEILDNQEKEMLKLADLSIASAQADLKNLNNLENTIALQNAINEKKGIEAQITGFRSEQLTNQVSLEKELGEIKTQIALEGISAREREVAEVEAQYEELYRLAEKSGEDTTMLEEQKQQKLNEIRQAGAEEDLGTALALTQQITATIQAREDYETDAIDKKFADKLAQAEGDAVATEKIEGEIEAEKLAIKKKFASKKKKAAIAEAMINTFLSASKSMADFGFPVGAVFAALAIAQGLTQVQSISNAPAFADGGMVGGYGSGTSDSVNARLSRGESVINANSTRMFKPLLSSINEAGGGRAFAGNDGTGGQTSGVVKAFVVADDMTNEQDKLTRIRRKATI